MFSKKYSVVYVITSLSTINDENTFVVATNCPFSPFEYIDSDAIRFNDISNSQQSADALNIDDSKEATGYIPLNEEVKQAERIDLDKNNGEYFIDKEITLSKKESNDTDKEDKIHLLSELDGPDDGDIDNIYQDDLTEEDYDKDLCDGELPRLYVGEGTLCQSFGV